MLKWILKIAAGIIIWAIVALFVGFIGGLLFTVEQTQVRYLGDFLKDAAGLIGFIAGAAYVIWGRSPVDWK